MLWEGSIARRRSVSWAVKHPSRKHTSPGGIPAAAYYSNLQPVIAKAESVAPSVIERAWQNRIRLELLRPLFGPNFEFLVMYSSLHEDSYATEVFGIPVRPKTPGLADSVQSWKKSWTRFTASSASRPPETSYCFQGVLIEGFLTISLPRTTTNRLSETSRSISV